MLKKIGVVIVIVILSGILLNCSQEKEHVVSPTNTPMFLNNQENMSCSNFENPVSTSNSEFRIELTHLTVIGEHLREFGYEVCKLEKKPGVRNLNYWVLGLEQLFPYLAAEMTLSDLYVSCGIRNLSGHETCGLVVLDPATQVVGVKFDGLNLEETQCQSYVITLDESALIEEFQLDEGGVLSATNTGNQDVTDSELPAPGFSCAAGPVVSEKPQF